MQSITVKKQYDENSRDCEILSEYLKINNNNECSHVFDKLFIMAIDYFGFKQDLNEPPEEIEKLFKTCEKLNSSEILAYLYDFADNYSYQEETLYSVFKPISNLFSWSPKKSLTYIFNDFKKNGYGTSSMELYFNDKDKIKKIISAGFNRDLTEHTLFNFFCDHFDKEGNPTKKSLYFRVKKIDLTKEFSITPIEFWDEVMEEFGIDKELKGYETEFSTYLMNLNSLGKFWDLYKSQEIKQTKTTKYNKFDDENFINVYSGKYEDVPEIELDYVNEEESDKLIVDWNKFNSFGTKKQKSIRAYLLQNLVKLNNYIQLGVNKVYSTLKKIKNNKFEQNLSLIMKSNSYYNKNNNSLIVNLQKTLSKRLMNNKINTIADGMDFILHQYIPLLYNYKSSTSFNSIYANAMMNSDVLSIFGASVFLKDEKPKEKIVEKEKIVIKYLDKPIVGGNDIKSSTDEFLNSLVKLQEEFNNKYMGAWREILNKLNDIADNNKKILVSDLDFIKNFEKIMVLSPQTLYKLSGIYKAEDYSQQYLSVIITFIDRLKESKTSILMNCINPLERIKNLLINTKKEYEECKIKYNNSDKSELNLLYADISRIKINSDITQSEIIKFKDACRKLIMSVQSSNNYSLNNEEILKKYISSRSDKNKLIDDYFNLITNNLKTELIDVQRRTNEEEIIKLVQDTVNKRLMINIETHKSYRWLNETLDKMLAQNRISQMNSSVLSTEMIKKIEATYLNFKKTVNKETIDLLIKSYNTKMSNEKYFNSYFKVIKFAKKLIEKIGIFDYLERLYKELELTKNNFNWESFKEKLIVYFTNSMVRLDVFHKKNDSSFEFINFFKDLSDIDLNTNLPTELIDGSTNTWVIETLNRLLSITNLTNEQYKSKKTFAQISSAIITNQDKLKIGFSLRSNLSDYYPLIKELPIKTIKSLFTPIIQILDKYIEQRSGDSLNINVVMKGGEKIEGSSIYDIIKPHEIMNVEVIPEATKLYISGYYILKFYDSIFSKNTIKDKIKLEYFQISSLYKLKYMSKNKDKEEDFKILVSVLNDFWKSTNDNDVENKISSAINLFINEINSSILFGSPDEIKLFKDNFLTDTFFDSFATNFDKISNLIKDGLNTYLDTIGTISASSISILNNMFEKGKKQIIEVSPPMRLNVLRNFVTKQKGGDESTSYNNFCETCLTPLVYVISYYSSIIGSILKPSKLNTKVSYSNFYLEDFESFKNKYINNYFVYGNNLNMSGGDEENLFKADFVRRIPNFNPLVIYPECNKDNVTIKDIVEHIYKEYYKDLDQCIHNIMNYPTHNDEKIYQLKIKLHEKIKEQYEADLVGIQNIQNDTNLTQFYKNLIPSVPIPYYEKLFARVIYDNKYNFNNKNIKKINPYDREVSFTQFVSYALSCQHRENYLPQTFMDLIEDTQLYNITFSNINAKPKYKKEENDVQMEHYVYFGGTPYTNFLFYLSKTEDAVNQTTTNLMKPSYATSLVSLIPILIHLLDNYLSIIPNNYNYCCTHSEVTPIYVNAQSEINILKQILFKLYSDVLPFSNKIQFMDSLNLNTNHSFTELLPLIQDDNISFNKIANFGLFEWINPIYNSEFGISYTNEDRFKNYMEKYIKSTGDINFEKQFESIIKLMAKLSFNNIISHIEYLPDTKMVEKRKNIMFGGDYNKQDCIKTLARRISRNPLILSQLGKYGFSEIVLNKTINQILKTKIKYDNTAVYDKFASVVIGLNDKTMKNPLISATIPMEFYAIDGTLDGENYSFIKQDLENVFGPLQIIHDQIINCKITDKLSTAKSKSLHTLITKVFEEENIYVYDFVKYMMMVETLTQLTDKVLPISVDTTDINNKEFKGKMADHCKEHLKSLSESYKQFKDTSYYAYLSIAHILLSFENEFIENKTITAAKNIIEKGAETVFALMSENIGMRRSTLQYGQNSQICSEYVFTEMLGIKNINKDENEDISDDRIYKLYCQSLLKNLSDSDITKELRFEILNSVVSGETGYEIIPMRNGYSELFGLNSTICRNSKCDKLFEYLTEFYSQNLFSMFLTGYSFPSLVSTINNNDHSGTVLKSALSTKFNYTPGNVKLTGKKLAEDLLRIEDFGTKAANNSYYITNLVPKSFGGKNLIEESEGIMFGNNNVLLTKKGFLNEFNSFCFHNFFDTSEEIDENILFVCYCYFNLLHQIFMLKNKTNYDNLINKIKDDKNTLLNIVNNSDIELGLIYDYKANLSNEIDPTFKVNSGNYHIGIVIGEVGVLGKKVKIYLILGDKNKKIFVIGTPNGCYYDLNTKKIEGTDQYSELKSNWTSTGGSEKIDLIFSSQIMYCNKHKIIIPTFDYFVEKDITSTKDVLKRKNSTPIIHEERIDKFNTLLECVYKTLSQNKSNEIEYKKPTNINLDIADQIAFTLQYTGNIVPDVDEKLLSIMLKKEFFGSDKYIINKFNIIYITDSEENAGYKFVKSLNNGYNLSDYRDINIDILNNYMQYNDELNEINREGMDEMIKGIKNLTYTNIKEYNKSIVTAFCHKNGSFPMKDPIISKYQYIKNYKLNYDPPLTIPRTCGIKSLKSIATIYEKYKLNLTNNKYNNTENDFQEILKYWNSFFNDTINKNIKPEVNYNNLLFNYLLRNTLKITNDVKGISINDNVYENIKLISDLINVGDSLHTSLFKLSGGVTDIMSFNMTNDLINSYYSSESETFKKLYGSNINSNLESMIVSYYKQPLISFKTFFDKYTFVELLYNSVIYEHYFKKKAEKKPFSGIAEHEYDKSSENFKINDISIYKTIFNSKFELTTQTPHVINELLKIDTMNTFVSELISNLKTMKYFNPSTMENEPFSSFY